MPGQPRRRCGSCQTQEIALLTGCPTLRPPVGFLSSCSHLQALPLCNHADLRISLKWRNCCSPCSIGNRSAKSSPARSRVFMLLSRVLGQDFAALAGHDVVGEGVCFARRPLRALRPTPVPLRLGGAMPLDTLSGQVFNFSLGPSSRRAAVLHFRAALRTK